MNTEIRTIKADVGVYLFEEDSQWVAYCPSLELSSYGDDMEEAKEAFSDALEILLDHLDEHGTLEKELLRLGWSLTKRKYTPPVTKPGAIKNLGSPKKVRQPVHFPVGGHRGTRSYGVA